MQLLEENGIDLLVDVRSSPYSRYHPQFNREVLENALRERNIDYVYAGKYLGGRPTDPSCYKNGSLPTEGADYLHEVDYPEVMKHDWFQKGVQRLLELADEHSAAIMCSEANPAECHRHHLIAKYLQIYHPEVDVRHIRQDGSAIGANSVLTSVAEVKAKQIPMF